MRKVKIYTKFSKSQINSKARIILKERLETKALLDNITNPHAVLYPANKDGMVSRDALINEIAKDLPTEEFRYNGYFHCWKQASDEDTHWATGIIEDEEGWCNEEEVRDIKFEDWK